MKSNEFRIGNYIIDTEDDNIMVITSGKQIDGSDLMNPIPLTEEWLIKFGFHKWVSDKTKYNHSEMYGDYITKHGDGYNLFDYEGNDVLNYDLKYVHQLQNLYHALTGEELCVK